MSTCIICSDVFDSSSDVYVTLCGHLFHYPCVLGWLKRSKSCPQCRNKITEKTIHRVYLNILAENNIKDLKLQLQLKESDEKHYEEKLDILTKQNENLRKEMKNLETKLASSESNLAMMKKDYDRQHNEIQEVILRMDDYVVTLKNENEELHNKLKSCQSELAENKDNVKQLKSENRTLKRKIEKVEEALLTDSSESLTEDDVIPQKKKCKEV